jgi:hypothetical protein
MGRESEASMNCNIIKKNYKFIQEGENIFFNAYENECFDKYVNQ